VDSAQAAEKAKSYQQCLEEILRLRKFDGEPSRFWQAYLGVLARIAEADSSLVAVRVKGGTGTWRILAAAPGTLLTGGIAETLLQELGGVASEALEKGAARSDGSSRYALAVRLHLEMADEACVAAFVCPPAPQADLVERLRRLQLVCDMAAGYQLGKAVVEARTRASHFAGVLDLMVLLNAEKRFLSAAMTFCNELASRHRCERVSLGWLEKGYVRLQAVSRVDRFDRKEEAAQMLEAAMEEAVDQDIEIVLPPDEPGGPVRRDHEAYAKANDVSHICSLPLRSDGEAVAACTCERSAAAFSESEMRLLRLSCDQAARRLADLKSSDRWFGARLAASTREKLGRLLGYQHTGAKVLAIVVAAALAIVFLGTAQYRVKSAAVLRTDDLAQITAPFDGHIAAALARVGDSVSQGQELVRLDQTELLLQEAEAVAERSRYDREFEKAQGSNALADMRIADALRGQAEARLALLRYRLDQAVIRAPFAGVIVEGDLNERIGSPVRQGDALIRLGRIENLYVELEVDEADIHEVTGRLGGEVALASRPQERYPITITQVEPVAVARDQKNVFIVKAAFQGAPQSWWRPGMSGVARISVGRRSLAWMASHRTVDFLRLRLWW
jgi:hypothetical protein